MSEAFFRVVCRMEYFEELEEVIHISCRFPSSQRAVGAFVRFESGLNLAPTHGIEEGCKR